MKPIILPFKIGADPEFTMINRNSQLHAQSTMEQIMREYSNKIRNDGYYVEKFGNIGWDGASYTAEIRPNASNNIDIVTNNIKQLLSILHSKCTLIDFTTENSFAPIGGHVHLDVKDGYLNKNVDEQKQIQILHKKIMGFYTPIQMGEIKKNAQKRLRSSYGKYTAYEYKRIDNKLVYEIKVPTAEWIMSEKVAKAMLAYIATIHEEIMNNKTIKNINKIKINKISELDMTQIMVMSNKTIAEKLLKETKEIVRTFKLYKQYKREIEFIMNPAKVLEHKNKINHNILKGWNIEARQPNKKNIFNTKRVEFESNKINIEPITSLIPIYYNNDMMVQDFVLDIKKRCIALGWKLKNSYYLYGIKKGITTPVVSKEQAVYMGYEDSRTSTQITETQNLINKITEKTSQLKATNRIIEDKVICIGLPYNMRIKQNKKELLNIIYRMENNKIQEQIIPITFKNSNDDNEGIVDIPKDSEKIQVIEENSSMPSTIRYYRELLNETNEEDSEEDVE